MRTTESRHAALVVDVLGRCWERGDIYAADYEGWYCVDCEEFKVRAGGGQLILPSSKPTDGGEGVRILRAGLGGWSAAAPV